MLSKPLMAFAILSLTLLVNGCGSVLATLEKDKIAEDPGTRSIATRVLDESIETKAVVNIRAEDPRFDLAHFTVLSFNGYVLIAGQVPFSDMIEIAANEIRQLEGVRRIYNELEAAPNTDAARRTKDAWISTQVRSRLLFTPDTPAARVSVFTEKGVVYLMGLLTKEEADRVAAAAAKVSDVVRVVRLFEEVRYE